MPMDCKDILSGSRIALVLQGGGALGAYQAGVFQALDEHQLTPEWVVGTSIGAINAAIIAGNEPRMRLLRLREFWERIAHRDSVDMSKVPDSVRKLNTWIAAVDATLRGVPGFYSPRLLSPFMAGLAVEPEVASFYDTSALAETLRELVDFDYLNAKNGMRMTVNALKVTSGELTSFDNSRQTIGPQHIMASGALPPGFPAVRIDGDLYWDGGLYSNTPLETILEDEPRKNTLCFMVDLWSPDGDEPTTFDEVQTRQKDVMYASRSKRHIDTYQQMHNLRRRLHALEQALSPAERERTKIKELTAHGCNTVMHIVRLPYSGRDWHMASKDINFSKGSIEWRWNLGYEDALQAIKQGCWLKPVKENTGVVIHELQRETKQLESR